MQAGKAGPSQLAKATGKAGFFLFLYLEVLDASFSFDGVIGAFAITTDPILIALGLGLIGAMFVRSLTVFLVRKGTLADYVYLEHGAHWAIGALAVILLVGIGVPRERGRHRPDRGGVHRSRRSCPASGATGGSRPRAAACGCPPRSWPHTTTTITAATSETPSTTGEWRVLACRST